MHVRSLEDCRPEGGFETKYFKVQKHSGDDAFVQSLPRLPDKCLKTYRKRYRSLSTQQIIARLLLGSECLPFMKIYQELAVKANDFSFFNKAVVLAAKFVGLLYSEEGLRNYCCEDRLQDQLNNLWEFVLNEGKKDRTIGEVWKNTMLHVKGERTDKYCFVQEPHVSKMIRVYAGARVSGRFDAPYDQRVTVSQLPQIKESSLYEDICRALLDMECFYSLTDDAHTRLLVLLARGKFREIKELLVSESDFTDVSTPTIDNDGFSHEPVEYLQYIFDGLASHFRYVIWEDMLDLISPSDQLVPLEIFTHTAVCEVFEIAELRRRALGRRFITRDLLVWSFYKLGYGLPPDIRDTLKLGTDNAAEDHPLSQMLRAATKLVVSLDERKIELEHVMFAFLYLMDVDVDLDLDPAGACLQHYRQFMQVVERDIKERPQGSTSQDDFQFIFDGIPNYQSTSESLMRR